MHSNQLPDHVRTQTLTHFRHNYMLFRAQHQTPSRGCLTLLDALIITTTGQWVRLFTKHPSLMVENDGFLCCCFLKCSLNHKSM